MINEDLVKETINQKVNTILALHGGKAEFVEMKDNVVYVKLTGKCQTCAFAAATLKGVVQKVLQQEVDPFLIVESV